MTASASITAGVLGAGIGGLLSAAVLARHADEVTIIERDRVQGVVAPRPGVPHGPHAHALLARGQEILDELFPGLMQDLEDSGVFVGDLAGDLRWYFRGSPTARENSGLKSVSATRPVLEFHIRERVQGLANVRFMEGISVRGLTFSPSRDKVTGVLVDAGSGGQELPFDLVVDTTGRGTQTPRWLEEAGYERPKVSRIKVDLAYTTQKFELDRDPYGTDLSINPVAHPKNPRGAFFPKLEDGTSALSLTGMLGDHPPLDLEGFKEFARTLDAPEIYEAIKDAQPVGRATTFKFMASTRRYFETLKKFPGRFLVLGDAICSFNPVYGQGMTVAAIQADQLDQHFQEVGAGDHKGEEALRYFKRVTPAIDVAWGTSSAGDLGFPGVEGPRPLAVKVGNLYIERLHRAAAIDGRITSAFFTVAGRLENPFALMRPSVMAKVVRPSDHTIKEPVPASAERAEVDA